VANKSATAITLTPEMEARCNVPLMIEAPREKLMIEGEGVGEIKEEKLSVLGAMRKRQHELANGIVKKPAAGGKVIGSGGSGGSGGAMVPVGNRIQAK
jgi:hypothetical protein